MRIYLSHSKVRTSFLLSEHIRSQYQTFIKNLTKNGLIAFRERSEHIRALYQKFIGNIEKNSYIAFRERSEHIRPLYQKFIGNIEKNSYIAFRERSEQIASPAYEKRSGDDTSRERSGAARRGEGNKKYDNQFAFWSKRGIFLL